MIELFEQNVRTYDRQSSKGNQLKWENDGIWYKGDFTGYEGLAEYVVSKLLQKSSLHQDEFVSYELEQIRYKKIVYNGAKSGNFLTNGWKVVTLERLFQEFYKKSLYTMLWSVENPKMRLQFLVEQVERITGLKNFGIYMNKLLTVDAFFLNEDRHTHNIAILMDHDRAFALCPMFDHGGSLLSDTNMDYPLGEDLFELLSEVKGKTISLDFDEQLDVSESLYGRNLKFYFTKKDVDDILESVQIYSKEEVERVRSILYLQMEKYRYLF